MVAVDVGLGEFLVSCLIGDEVECVAGADGPAECPFGVAGLFVLVPEGQVGKIAGVVEVGEGRCRARTNRATPVHAGDQVRVAAIDGVTLEVEPLEGAARDYRERRGKSDEAETSITEADDAESTSSNAEP